MWFQHSKKCRLIAAALALDLLGATTILNSRAKAEEQFEKYEIRVIRPKYFTKTGRLETGAQLSVIMNQSFIYTYLATGLLDYHFSEQFAAEGTLAFGFSVDDQDKTSLKSNFGIKTQVLRTEYIGEVGLLYTPVYGKYQLTSGRLIYLDMFISAGAGMTGVSYLYDDCPTSSDGPNISDPPSPKVVPYPTGFLGVGQRIFMDKKLSLRWDVRGHFFMYNLADGACNPSTASGGSNTKTNITAQLGAGYFL